MAKRTTLFAGAFAIGLMLAAPAHAAPPRLVEAWAEAPVDRTLPMRISPGSAAQAADPVFILIANQLGDALAGRGFNLVGKDSAPAVVLLVDYIAYDKPYGTYFDGALSDPAYRALIVTALEARSIKGPNDPPHVLWQTVVDSGGFSANPREVIPKLVSYGARYYGEARTPRGLGAARWCADGDVELGTLIRPDCPAQPGAPPTPHPPPIF